LAAMVQRNVSMPVRLHVFTEAHRSVPDHMTKHVLEEWPQISGGRRAWWYKMQLFDPRRGLGRLLYFDLDVVISGSLDWICALDSRHFWTIHDWRRLWRPQWRGINSSMMLWDRQHAAKIWQRFCELGLPRCVSNYHGDQDLLTEVLDPAEVRFFDDDLVKSWRWQIKDGGMDPKTRRYARPDAGSVLTPGLSVMVLHGQPKPHEIQDSVIKTLWAAS